MYTYIKSDIRGFYVELEDKLTEELYNNIGTTWDDFINGNWVLLSDEQAKFHKDNPSASIDEVWEMELEPVHVRDLADAKHEKLIEINRYDASENVNSFTINETVIAWLTVQERNNYKSSIDAAKLLGVETLSFYIGDALFNIKTDAAERMLAQLQLYADQCYIVTKQHIAAVDALETIEEVDNYDFTVGYPERLKFEIK